MKKVFLFLALFLSLPVVASATYPTEGLYEETHVAPRMEKNEAFFVSTKIGQTAKARMSGANLDSKIDSQSFFDLEVGKVFDFSKSFKTAFSLELMHYNYNVGGSYLYDSSYNSGYRYYFYIDSQKFTETDLALNWYLSYDGFYKKFVPYFGIGLLYNPASRLNFSYHYLYNNGTNYYSSDYYYYRYGKQKGDEFALQFKLGFMYYILDNFNLGLEYTISTNNHYFGDSKEIEVKNNMKALQFKLGVEFE